jgi:hypothetical protein
MGRQLWRSAVDRNFIDPQSEIRHSHIHVTNAPVSDNLGLGDLIKPKSVQKSWRISK